MFVSSWEGELSDSDLLAAYKQLLDSEQYKPGFHEIADLRNAQLATVTADGLRELNTMVVDRLTGKSDDFKTAIIAPENLPFGFSRLYEAYSQESPENVTVFREVSKALQWIGVDDAFIE